MLLLWKYWLSPFPTTSSLTFLVGDSELNLYFAALKSRCLFGKVAICFLRIRGYLFLDVHCPSLSIVSGYPRLVSARKQALNVFKGIVVSRCFDMSLEFHTVFCGLRYVSLQK